VSAFAGRLPRISQAVRVPLVFEAGALALVVGAAAYVFTRDLHTYPNFDEGNYLGSLDALRHGQSLGATCSWTSRRLVPPARGVSYPFGNSVTGVRTGLMVVALLAIVAAYACGRLAGGPVAGIVAAAVMAIARPFAGFAALVESEPASAALAVVAVALAVVAYNRASARVCLRFRSRPGRLDARQAARRNRCPSDRRARATLRDRAGLAAPPRPRCGCSRRLRSHRRRLPRRAAEIWHGVFVTHARILGTSTAASNLHRAATFVDPRTRSAGS